KKKITVKVSKKATTTTTTTETTVTASPQPTATSQANVATDELIHYDMKTSEDGTTLLDQSGKNNDASLVGVNPTLRDNNSIYLDGSGDYINLPADVFAGRDTFTISIWAKDYSGSINTSAMFVGTTENMPVSYWLLNPTNPSGSLKCVFTNTENTTAPYNTEVGVGGTRANLNVAGPKTGTEWNHFVAVVEPNQMTTYCNGSKIATTELSRSFSSFGTDLAAYIGRSSYPDETFRGFVREVQVFSSAKTEAEVADIYEKTKGDAVVDKGQESKIFIADRADPYIVKADDGYYYFTASYPMYGANDTSGYDRIVLRRSKTLSGLKDAEEKVIWNQADSTACFRHIWAPEMHYIGGKWYMYFAASDSASDKFHIDCNVLMCEGSDPYADSWVEKGKFQKATGDNSFGGFSLDMTYFENKGKSYVIWAEKKNGGLSKLYMGQVDPAEPWKLITKSVMISEPEYYWEKVTIPVNEGPSVIHHDGKVIVAFSASATGPEYCIGYLYADEDSDLMTKSSWTKQATPALASENLVDEYGPGHNSFTEDEDGNPIFVYHSRSKKCFEGKCEHAGGDPLYDPCRSAHLRKVTWDANGLPVLNAEPYDFEK
ncbi:MAG: family 43 glycosylhydrolase, partial [Eubacterium sp.]|nr:family 43 glycosylhydrolase [Eubacterium sp.]